MFDPASTRGNVSQSHLVGFKRSTQCYIPEDRTLQNHDCEDLKSYETWEVLKTMEGRIRNLKLEQTELPNPWCRQCPDQEQP
jgi:hypothetical protein